MFNKFKKFFSSKNEDKKINIFSQNLYFLIYEIIAADHIVEDIEIELTSQLIEKYFNISKDINYSELKKLQSDNHFNADLTKIAYDLKIQLPYDKRKNIIQICWQVLLVDHSEDILETSTVRKIGVLLGIEDNDFISIRNTVKKS